MMRKRRLKLVLMTAISAAGILAGCGSAAKDGTDALEAGDYEQAVTLFQEAASSDDRDKAAQGYRGLGMAYYETEDYEAALSAFQSALDNGTEQTTQLYNLMGVCAMQTEDYADALSYIQSGLALADSQEGEDAPDASLIQEMKYNEIICCERQGDWDTAKEKIAEYLTDYPDDEAAQKESEFLETR